MRVGRFLGKYTRKMDGIPEFQTVSGLLNIAFFPLTIFHLFLA
jgi:hypothetical protein